MIWWYQMITLERKDENNSKITPTKDGLKQNTRQTTQEHGQ